ncbi:DUF4221 family protein [Belliella pelovolcani]|uniref:DUF4221 family protein n=1 Tax=Belliella pelovolcani TaxID=529505 RepID=UPI003918DD04
MKRYQFASFLTLLLSYFSCNVNSHKEVTYELTSAGDINLAIDETTPDFSMGLQYVDSSDELVWNINWTTNSLQIYDLGKGELIKTISMEKEGDGGVGEIMAFHVYNMDSIFVFPFRGAGFSLIDSSGNLINRFKYALPENHTSGFVHNISYISPPVIVGNEIYFKTRPGIVNNYREMSSKMLADSHLAFRMNLDDLNPQLVPHHYPSDYLANGFKRFEFSSAQGSGKIVYSFFGDHQLYWSADFNSPLQQVSAKSKYLKDQLPLFPIDGATLESQKYSNASARYDNLLYDPYREVFYRFAYPELDANTEEEVRALRNNPGPFVVMVFDQNLKLVSEKYFEGGRYLPLNAFVGKKGLYISTNNPDNPENQEDLMGFEIFVLEEI